MTYQDSNIDFLPLPTHGLFRDITGQVFGKLTVLGLTEKRKNGYYWLCRCKCGNEPTIKGSYLTTSHTKSCGCYIKEVASRNFYLHGESHSTPEYSVYSNARERCLNPRSSQYHNYGGRGIEFRFESYNEFLETLGRRPTPQHSIDRKDTNGHYEKGNVRWATPSEQQRNRRNNRTLTIDGISQPMVVWAETSPVSLPTIWARLHLGWCEECSVLMPLWKSCIHR